MIEFTFQNNELVFTLPERMDNNNIPSLEAEIREILDSFKINNRENDNKINKTNKINELNELNKIDEIIFDLIKTQIITSTGLRMLLIFKKELKKVRVINASVEVYYIFDITGFTELMEIERAFRQISVDKKNLELLGSGMNGQVYRLNDDTILKVYNSNNTLQDIRNERYLSRAAFVAGIPTAIPFDVVMIGDQYGTLYELLNANVMSDLIRSHPERSKSEIAKYIKLVMDITSNLADDKMKLKSIKDEFFDYFKHVEKELDKNHRLKLDAIFEEIPESNHFVHGDLHMRNIMEDANGDLFIIDLDTLGTGDSIFELANIFYSHIAFRIIKEEDNLLNLPIPLYYDIWEEVFGAYYESLPRETRNRKTREIYVMAFLHLLMHLLKSKPEQSHLNKARKALYLALDNDKDIIDYKIFLEINE